MAENTLTYDRQVQEMTHLWQRADLTLILASVIGLHRSETNFIVMALPDGKHLSFIREKVGDKSSGALATHSKASDNVVLCMY